MSKLGYVNINKVGKVVKAEGVGEGGHDAV